MSSYPNAHVGYGFLVEDEEIISSIMEEEEDDDNKNIQIVNTGYCDEPSYLTICIRKSVKTAYGHDKPKSVKTDKWFIVDPEWDLSLKKYAEKIGIKNPKFDWFITASLF